MTNNMVSKIDRADYKVLIPSFGVLVLIIIAFTVFVPCPSTFQKVVLRLSIAAGVSGLFSVVFNQWDEKSQVYRGPVSLLLFVFIYLVATFSIEEGDCISFVKGKIYKGNQPFKGATVKLPQQDYQMISNGSGEVIIPFYEDADTNTRLFIQIDSQEGDTSFYLENNSTDFEIHLSDNIVELSKNRINQLVMARVVEFNKKFTAKLFEWQVDSALLCSYDRLIKLYMPYDTIKGYHQNRYEFTGLYRNIEYRKRLKNEGIHQMDPLPPYRKHHFDEPSIYLLKEPGKGPFRLSYLMLNRFDPEFTIVSQRKISDEHYLLTVNYDNNLKAVRVDINEERRKNVLKKRYMSFYGFLPTEQYDLIFKHGRWLLKNIKK